MKQILIFLIRCYQRILSPLFGGCCRYSPGCSAYAAEALEKYPVFKALRLSAARLLRCHPLAAGGLDPVP